MTDDDLEHLNHLRPELKQKIIHQKLLPNNAFCAVIAVRDGGEHETACAIKGNPASVIQWDWKRALPDDAKAARARPHWIIELINNPGDGEPGLFGTEKEEDILYRLLLVGIVDHPELEYSELIDQIGWVGLGWAQAYGEEIEDVRLEYGEELSAHAIPHFFIRP